MSRRTSVFAIAGIAVAVACVLAWRAAWTCDDALISFRYVRHWVAGDGLVFNAGEHVEGFSNFTFLVLLAPFRAAGADLFVAANVLGIVATAVQLAAVVWLFARREAPLAVIAFVAALFATDRIAIVWATGGLETAMHGALVLGVLALQLERPERIRTLAALHVALAASRPEGIVFAVVWFAHLAATRRWSELRRALNWFVPLAVVLVGARLVYYGAVVANPYRSKVDGVPTLAAGAHYALAFLSRMGLFGVAALATVPLVVLGVRAWRSAARWHAPLVLASAFVVVQLAAVLVAGGDYMTDFRLLAPIVGPFYVVIGCLAALAWQRRALAAAALVVLAAGHAYRQLAPDAISPGAPAPDDHKQVLTIARDQPQRFARALDAFAEPGDSILADWAGYMAYGHDLRTIDATGLVSAHVTRDFYLRAPEERLPGHARWPTIEFMQREHLTIIFPKINERPPEVPEIDEHSPQRRRDYPFLHVTVPLPDGLYLRFFTTLDADALARRARDKHVRVCFRPAFGAVTCIP